MNPDYVAVRPDWDMARVLNEVRSFGQESAALVVDSARVLIGIVTIDDIMDVAEEEITEDFHIGAAVRPLRRVYWDYSPLLLIRSRIGWLVGLVFVHLLSAGVLSAFEHVLAQ